MIILWTLIFFLAILLFISAYVSAAETALFSLSNLTLKAFNQSPRPREKLIARLMHRPSEVLVTVMILNVIANILVQNTVSSLFDEFPSWFLRVGVPIILTLVLGEIIPKALALTNNVKYSTSMAPTVYRLGRFFGPIRFILTHITEGVTRFLFLFMRKEKEISANEYRHVLKTSETSGALNPQETKLISGLFDLQEELVKETMRPREEILYYDIEEPIEELYRLFVDQQCSRVPVCGGDLENLKGILSARRFFFEIPRVKGPKDIFPALNKPFFIPETTKAWALLQMMRERGEVLSMVVDEYGSISGLITQEDLIESVIGEIIDLRDAQSQYTRSSDNVIIASGKLELDELNRIFGTNLESEETAVTLGGFIIEQLGEIPPAGKQLKTPDFLFHILAAEPNRIRRIYVRRLKPKRKPGK